MLTKRIQGEDGRTISRLELLQNQPELINSAVEEILRLASSNQLGNRITTQDTEIGGEQVAAGTPIKLCIGAANRNPAQFPDPDRMDIQRSPNRHLAFASGIHRCVGEFGEAGGTSGDWAVFGRYPA